MDTSPIKAKHPHSLTATADDPSHTRPPGGSAPNPRGVRDPLDGVDSAGFTPDIGRTLAGVPTAYGQGSERDRPPGISGIASHLPHTAVRDRPHTAVRDRPHTAVRDRPHTAVRDRPHSAVWDRLHPADGVRPHTPPAADRVRLHSPPPAVRDRPHHSPEAERARLQQIAAIRADIDRELAELYAPRSRSPGRRAESCPVDNAEEQRAESPPARLSRHPARRAESCPVDSAEGREPAYSSLPFPPKTHLQHAEGREPTPRVSHLPPHAVPAMGRGHSARFGVTPPLARVPLPLAHAHLRAPFPLWGVDHNPSRTSPRQDHPTTDLQTGHTACPSPTRPAHPPLSGSDPRSAFKAGVTQLTPPICMPGSSLTRRGLCSISWTTRTGMGSG